MLDFLYTMSSRVRALWRRRSAERELSEELSQHIELETEKNVRAGLSGAEARRRALLAFGGLDAHSEVMRDRRSFRWLEEAWVDARYALRGFRRSLGFTMVAVLTLGVGIGASTAIFTVVNAVLLRPLPYADADRLAIIFAQRSENDARFSNISYEDYRSWKREQRSFETFGIFNWTDHTISGDAQQAERVAGAEVDADLFRVLGTPPLLGRSVRSDEEVSGRDRVVVLGYGLWQRRFGGARDVLGRVVTVDGQPHTVIGVMPAGFQFPYSGELWRPMAPTDIYTPRGNRFLAGAVGRLRADVTREQAEADLRRISLDLQRAFPDSNTGWEAQYVPMREDLFGPLRPAIAIVFAAAGLVLLIVCGNLASLLLARSAARVREIALRAAIGAGRNRLIRQFLTETVVLTMLGSVLALLVAYWGVGVLRSAIADRIPTFITITPDLWVYLFAAGVALFVALLTGVLPALHGTRVDAITAIKDGDRATLGLRGARLRGALVVAEVALAVVLLVGSTLLSKSMRALTGVDIGFQHENVLTARYNLPATKYDSGERRAAFQHELLERLRATPGIAQVGAAQGTPFSGWNVGMSYQVEGEPPAPVGKELGSHYQVVTPEFFETLGVPMVKGRMIAATDRADGVPVAVVNESLAARHFAGADPIGKRVRIGDGRWLTIVGVVADYRHYALRQPMGPAIYAPYAQDVPSQMTVAMRTAGAPADMIPTLRRVFAELDADVPPERVRTLDEVIARQTWVERIARDILLAFATAAALLAVIGLYGVIAYSVARQRHEIGIRLALGAAPQHVLRLIVRRGLALAIAGITIGMFTALVAVRSLRELLYEVKPLDLPTFLLVPLLVASFATLAAWIPARRAAATDPMVALREE